MKTSSSGKNAPDAGRRGFLRRSGQGGLLAGAAALGAAAGGDQITGTAKPAADEGQSPSRYHESEHIRKYYASSRIF